jgi:hypothetical protein
VVENLGWARETDKIVFGHTHQPLTDVSAQSGPPVRFWNTGSWIYEPELSSAGAYARYLQNGWPARPSWWTPTSRSRGCSSSSAT